VKTQRPGNTGAVFRVLAVVLIALVGGCGGDMAPRLNTTADVDLTAKGPTKLRSRRGTTPPAPAGRGNYQLFEGTEQGLGDDTRDPPPGVVAADGKYTINVDRADIAEVTKLVLGETLGFSYVIDPRVQGTITLSSSRALSSVEVLDAFEAALRLNGAGLVRNGETMKIVALQEILEGEIGSADLQKDVTSGYGVSAIPLRYISAANMMELMDSFIARGGSVRASKIGNLVLVRGSADERRTLVDVVRSFDVDWMKSQSAGIAILANGTPQEMVAKLEAIFAEDTAGSGENSLKVVPLERLNGVVLISNSQKKVKRALQWVARLDKASTTETGYYVYAVQNGSADAMAKILISTFVDKSDAAGVTAEVAPDEPIGQVTTDTGAQGGADTGGAQTNQTGKVDLEGAEGTSTSTPAATTPERPPDLAAGIRITANTANNTLVIRASQREYQKILSMLREIDAPGVQVLINTTIAEVSLNDNLQYGVQAYLKANDVSGGVFNGNSLTLRPNFPGLNFLLGSTSDPRLVLDALSAVTKVRIVSSPSVLVLENETATIKVGDQVPIKTQEIANTTDADTVTNSFEYRDTGVILKVKPRVNSSGLVTMELGQELSSVVQGSGSSQTEQENPTFSQRAVTSKVSVYSTQTVVLGGLISGQDSRQRRSVPVINKIPIIGDLIGDTNNGTRRNELVIFITPQIIQDGEDASKVSEELRSKMRLFNPN
jgi:general secretion pathway protein D